MFVAGVSLAVFSLEAKFGDFLKTVAMPQADAQQETAKPQNEPKPLEAEKPAGNACAKCGGSGSVTKGVKTRKCKACGGTGVIQRNEAATPAKQSRPKKKSGAIDDEKISELEKEVDPADVAFAVDADIDDLKAALADNKSCLLIDVREPNEFASGHIKGAINIPVGQIANRIGSVCKDKDRDIYVYCQVGKRSRMAANKLVKRGYTMVHNVEGGLDAWDGPLVK